MVFNPGNDFTFDYVAFQDHEVSRTCNLCQGTICEQVRASLTIN